MKVSLIIILMNRITVKRINNEIKRFLKTKPTSIQIYHNCENILEIYFKFNGLDNSIYNNGKYICKIHHDKDYPAKAPNVYILTPNGRFRTNVKLCLTNTSYHPEAWAAAAWNLENFVQAFISVFHSNTKSDRIGIGHIKEINEPSILKFVEGSNTFNKHLEKELELNFI